MDGVGEAAAATPLGVSLLLLCPRCCDVVSNVMVEQGGFVVQEYAQTVVYASDSWKMEHLVLVCGWRLTVLVSSSDVVVMRGC
jgi:hypothetical protein